MTDHTDEQLMLAFSRGDTAAFTPLFARYKQHIFAFFRRRLADPALAEELAQDTFVALLRGTARYEPTALFRTYLYAIALRILHADRRKTTFRSNFFTDSDHEPSQPSTSESDLILRDALAHLDPADREVLMLREFEQLTYAEIANLLDLPLNTVRSRLFRARLALHAILAAPAKSTYQERV